MKGSKRARFRTGPGAKDVVEFDAAEEEDDDNLLPVDEDNREEEDDDMFAGGLDDDSSGSSEEEEEEDDDDEEEEEEEYDDDDDDEEEEDETSKLLRWGRSKSQLYGGDTADLEIGQDVEEAEEEEALAAELNRRQYESLDPMDFALEGDDEVEVEGAEVGLFHRPNSSRKVVELKPLAKALEMASNTLTTRIRPALRALSGTKLDDMFTKEALSAARLFCLLTEQLLLCQCSNIGFAMLLAQEGTNPASHPVMARLLSLKRRLEGLEPSAEKAEPVISAALRSTTHSATLQNKRSAIADDSPKPKKQKAMSVAAKIDAEDRKRELDEDEALEVLPQVHGDDRDDPRPTRAAVREARKAFKQSKRGGILTGEADVDFDASYEADDRSEESSFSGGEADEEELAGSEGGEEDEKGETMDDAELEFLRAYEEKASEAKSKKAEKKKTYTVQPRYGAWLDSVEDPAILQDGRRAASREIVENRGLAPHRPKKNRNPRVKKREQFRRAVIRRKGQVRDAVPQGTDKVNYGGEVTGIRAKISRSRRVVS